MIPAVRSASGQYAAGGTSPAPLPPPPTPDSLQPLPRDFFVPSAKVVAPKLLGHCLVRRLPEGLSGGLIVEAEAYLQGDPACHAYRGETARNRSMFGPPGHAYLYFIYGNYWCFNVVCGPAGVAEAVLVRALEPVFGTEHLAARRPVERAEDLTNGPAKLCRALDLDRRQDGADLCDPASPVFLAAWPAVKSVRRRRGPLLTTPRIGLTRAADWPLRFCLGGSRFLSRPVRG